jgi:uncharacterized SAM-binding protein YcdF (DUF218 family)
MLLRRVLLPAVVLLVLGWLAATAVLFLWPREDSPVRANAVVVLAGGRTPRLEKALGLMRRHVAPVLVISDGRDPLWPQANRLCAGHAPFVVLCFRPKPYSTRGEAEQVARIAAKRRWRSIVVVTSRYHVTRARMLFERCFHGDVDTVGAPYPVAHVVSFVVSEWAKLVWALTVSRAC